MTSSHPLSSLEVSRGTLTSFTLTLYPKGLSMTGGLSFTSKMVTCKTWSFFRGGVPRSEATTCGEKDGVRAKVLGEDQRYGAQRAVCPLAGEDLRRGR